jgi:hypothetical protein
MSIRRLRARLERVEAWANSLSPQADPYYGRRRDWSDLEIHPLTEAVKAWGGVRYRMCTSANLTASAN